MATFRESLSRAAQRGLCNITNTPLGAVLIGNAYINRALGFNDLARRQAAAAKALECGDEPLGEPPPPAFTGGQCPGTIYRITFSGGGYPNGTCTVDNSSGSFTVVGPVRGPFTDSVSPPPGGPLCPGTSGTRVYLRTGPSQNIEPLVGYSFGAFLNSISVSPESGPDNCGDIPPEYPDPAPIDIDVDITFDDVLGVEVTIPVNINYSPSTVNFDGSVRVPISVNVNPDITIDGSINLSTGDVTFNLGGNNPPGRTDEEPETELPPDDEPDPPDDEPPPPGFGIAGVFVYSNRVSRTRETIIPFNIAGSILAPRIASVKFEILGGDLGAWTTDIDVKGVSAFVPCPVEWGASRVQVRWEPGWDGQFIPLYRDLPSV